MIDWLFTGTLENFSLVMLVAAIVCAGMVGWAKRDHRCIADRLLGWLLLLAVGVTGIYTFAMHVFFPAQSAAEIGWAVSPFQYEVGIANLAVGVVALLAFWSGFGFRLAASLTAAIWYGGDAAGHIQQMVEAHNFSPGNAGPWFWTDVLVPVLLLGCSFIVWRRQNLS